MRQCVSKWHEYFEWVYVISLFLLNLGKIIILYFISSTVFAVNSALTEYQAGFRTCIAGVHQYLLMSNANPALAHLANALLCLSARLPESSTADSDALNARAPTSPRPDVTRFPETVKATQRVEQKRTELCKKDKPTHKHISNAPTNLQQNYWRPW